MSRSLGITLIVALVAVTLLGSVAPAKAASPTIEEQACAWLHHQNPVVSVFGGWSVYDVDLTCSRTARIPFVSASDSRFAANVYAPENLSLGAVLKAKGE